MVARLVITGASGQLARRAAEFALASGGAQRLVLCTRHPDALVGLESRGVEVRYCDFDEPDSLPGAFAGGERLLLVSATDLERRVEQHLAAIGAARAAGVEHVIYTSGLAPEPPNPAVVAPSHYATEQALRTSGLKWTVLRNSLYADYQMAEAIQAVAAGVLVHNRGDGAAAYVAREDCAAVAAAVLARGGHENAVYDVTGPEPFTAADLAALYGELGDRPIAVRALDDAAFIATIVGSGSGDDHQRYGAELVASFGRSIREGYMRGRTDTVAKLTGRAPITLRRVLEPMARRA
jgi:NAD(P)H dehydrogenase (quinone)